MPGLASADPHTLSTLSISRTNSQARNNGITSNQRNSEQMYASEQSTVENRSALHRKEFPAQFDARAAEESLSLYCKPIELYNIIQRRASRNPTFLQRCLSYKLETAQQRRLKLTISIAKVSTIPCDSRVKPVEKFVGQMSSVPEYTCQSVLVMLTTRVSASGMGYSCFQLSQTRFLRSSSAGISSSESTEQSSVTFVLPEVRKLLLTARKDSAVIVFITSADLNPNCNGSSTQIESSVSSTGAVLWGSISLATLCQNWFEKNCDKKHVNGRITESLSYTSHLDMCPSKLQLVNSSDGRCISFQSTSHSPIHLNCMARLELNLVGDEVGRSLDKPKSEISNHLSSWKSFNGTSFSQARKLQPGQVVFHYYYYFNQLYKIEVTENYSCPFCVQCCSSLKGLKCHLNCSHDLFTFDFLANADFRLVNVYCRDDVLDPEGNVRDIDRLNDPRRKNFVFWSRSGRPRKVKVPLALTSHSTQDQADEFHAKGLSSSACLLSPSMSKSRHTSSDGKISKDALPSSGFDKVRGSINGADNTTTCASNSCVAESAGRPAIASPMQMQPRKHGRTDEQGKLHALQAFKKQRLELDENKSIDHVISPNNVCLAISAPTPADKLCLQPVNSNQFTTFKSRVDKHKKSLVESSEPHIHSQLKKRQFYHSRTSQPMAFEQLLSDRDSEDEMDYTISELEDRRMLDDFVDVSQDEKELMHMWNSFVRKQRILADGHCPWACQAFTRLHAQKFHTNPTLRRCLLLFFIKLWNHNLVDGNTINRCFLIVDSFNEATVHRPVTPGL